MSQILLKILIVRYFLVSKTTILYLVGLNKMESNEKEVNGEKPVNILNGGNSEIFNDSSLGRYLEVIKLI